MSKQPNFRNYSQQIVLIDLTISVKNNIDTDIPLYFTASVIWLRISGKNCNFDLTLQNSELLSKYASMTFNILAFITMHINSSSFKLMQIQKFELGATG